MLLPAANAATVYFLRPFQKLNDPFARMESVADSEKRPQPLDIYLFKMALEIATPMMNGVISKN